MARACTICEHPERSKIEAAIVSGVSYRIIANQFALSFGSVQRHAASHLIEALQQAQRAKQEQEIASGSFALDRLAQGERIIDKFLEPFLSSEEFGDLTLKDALAEQRRQVELRAKIEGELDEQSVTVTAIPDWRDLRVLLLDALKNHPQARMDVLRALEAYDGKGA